MKNFVSPNSHPSSFLTGSTVESMIDKTKELGTGYYVCTDNGYLTNVMKAYSYTKKKELKLIAGCELYFVDENCDIIKGTKAEKIKYRTITLHAKNQAAYQFLAKKISEKNRPYIEILEQEYPVFNWKDLEEFSKQDFTAVVGGPQDIVCKNLLVNEPVVAGKIFKKLQDLFGNNLYSSIIPIEFDKKWVTSSVFTLIDGTTVTLDSTIQAETDYAKTFRVSLEEVAEKFEKHKTIRKIYVNGIGYNVNKDIMSACNHKDFKPIGTDIFEKYNNFIKAVSDRYGVTMLVNDYSYFSNEDDKLVQDLKLGEEVRVYPKHSVKSTEEVVDYLKKYFNETEIETIIDNTYKWASNFDNFELKYEYQLVKEHENHLQATMELVKKIGRFDSTNEVHRKRLKHEIDVIHANGQIDLLPYFFPISRVLNHYTDNGRIIGPARGSAGGSFLMYCMGITQTDPIKYGLYFSRFLTLGRILKGTLPDVDVDLPDRNLLMGPNGFFEENYKDRWAQLSTRTIMKLKSSIRDVNRFKKGKVEEEIEKMAKNIDANTPVYGVTDDEGNYTPGLMDSDESFKRYTEERPDEWEIVKRTLGIARQNGRHACGFVLSDKPLTETIPLMKVAGHENITQYEPKEIESAGLNKYDFLIVKCLNDIELALKNVNEKQQEKNFHQNPEYDFVGWHHAESDCWGCAECYPELMLEEPTSMCSVVDHICRGDVNADLICEKCMRRIGDVKEAKLKSGQFTHKGKVFYIWDLPEEDEVFQMLTDGKTETVFQLHTTSVTPYVMDMAPRSVEDCAVVTSLVRPGPLEFIDERTGRNMAQEYVERRHGRSKGEIPILDELIPETFGVMVFQEQITKITKELTGWDDEKAEDVRIAVGKKKMDMIMLLKPQFVEASAATGRVDTETAATIWAMIEKFGRYGFNKSHAVAYSQIAYACAYLKYHYPLEWWAAVLSNAEEKEITEVLWPHVRNILSPPDINLSKEEMVIDYSTRTIRNKLSVLRGLGEKVANRITEGRPYLNIEDFVSKKVVGASLTRKLIHVGVLDSLFTPGKNLMDKMQEYENTLEMINYKNKIFEKTEGEIVMNQPLDKFIEVAKNHPKSKRCKHEVKEGKIDIKYAFMNPIKDYILKKSIFPTMPMKLHDIIRNSCSNVIIINTEAGSYAVDPSGREVRLINGKTYQNIKNLECQPDSKQVINFSFAGYVVEAKEFSYQNGQKKALKMIVDIDGYLEEFVQWPDYDSGELIYPENLKKNCVVFLFMYRKMGRERYHTNISSIIVEDIFVD